MDDFHGLLAPDFGYKPQGKSAPMAPSRNTNRDNNNFNLGSGGSVHIRSSFSNKSAPIFDDHVGTDGLLFNNAFDGPLKYSESRGGASTTTSSFDYDSIFKDQNPKSASMPIFDKPVYDDDIFDGLPGLKNSSTDGGSASAPKFDNVFASVSSPPKQHRRPLARESSPFDDLLGNLGKKETESKTESRKVEKDSTAFDDLLPGFGGSSSPIVNRLNSEPGQFQKPSSNSARSVPGVMEDPFVVLESNSTPATSSGLFTDPLEEISKISNTGNTKVDSSSVNMAVFDDLDHLDDLGKSVPPEINKGGENRSPLRTRSSSGGAYSSVSKESVNKYPVENTVGHSQKKTPDDYQESHEAIFDMPAASTDFHRSFGQNVSPPSYVDINVNEINSSPRSEEVSESSDDAWLTVSEIPLFTQPTSAPPPSRPPPPRPPRKSKPEFGSFSSTNSRKKSNEYPFQNSTSYSQNTRPDHASRNSVTSQIDELEDFVTVSTQNNNEFADVLPGDDADKTSSAAASAAMKEAVDKAEAKFRQMREREYLKAARNKETGQMDKDMQDAQQRELKERHERFDRERQQREKEEEEREQRRFEKEREREREREEKEREQRRLERERERAREIEREREQGRQAVERATREARERAATEARLKAERSAMEKATAGARERAERAAVQRANAEARERAAAEAKERAEKTAAEARERANAEVREREARERAAVARAEADARLRAERSAVERAAAEARERAAAAAAAAAAARANQQKSDNDLESFFSARATSAQRPGANTSDPFSDSQNKGGPEPVRRTSVGATSSMRKTSSTTHIADDLTSLFGGGTVSSGEFQDVEGETDERRKARLERHQRTQERAAKALAEKNNRDLQAQREQAERHRISETLDVEIKRWAAGKEGNLRALLSTLQYVLWPECGWQPVSLTDLITGAAVKKVYRKATLCIHPDKVQQKGANLHQKYVAEKVFDLLKEAWNKFNSEELF